MQLYVARHGETDWNREGRYQGQRESRLTDLGRDQARALADALASCGPLRVVSSPLSRCVETAREIASRFGGDVEIDARLLEIGHGAWEGRLREEIERDDAETMRAWREAPQSVWFPGGESLDGVAARWRAFVSSLDRRRDTIAVTHDVVVRLAILQATGGPHRDFWKPRVVNGGYALLEDDGEEFTLVQECRDAHLGGLLVDTSRQAL